MICEVCPDKTYYPNDPYKRFNLLFGIFSIRLDELNLETYHLSRDAKVRFALDATLRYAIDKGLGLTQGLEYVNKCVRQYAILSPLPINFSQQVSEHMENSLVSWSLLLGFTNLPGIASDQEVQLYSKLASLNP